MKLEQRSLSCLASPSHSALAGGIGGGPRHAALAGSLPAADAGPRVSPHVPAPHVCTYAAPHPRALGFVSLPPRRIPARGRPPCRAVPAHSALGTLPQACCSREDKSAAPSGHGSADPAGLLSPTSQLAADAFPFFSSPRSVLPRGAAPAACRGSGAGEQREGVPADLLSTGIAGQGLPPRHCRGHSPPPNPSWHRAEQKGAGGTLGTPPVRDLSATDQRPSQVGPTRLLNTYHPPSTVHQAPTPTQPGS